MSGQVQFEKNTKIITAKNGGGKRLSFQWQRRIFSAKSIVRLFTCDPVKGQIDFITNSLPSAYHRRESGNYSAKFTEITIQFKEEQTLFGLRMFFFVLFQGLFVSQRVIKENARMWKEIAVTLFFCHGSQVMSLSSTLHFNTLLTMTIVQPFWLPKRASCEPQLCCKEKALE